MDLGLDVLLVGSLSHEVTGIGREITLGPAIV
ncbi:hypothetical protein GGP91_002797 [Salinibacter ruber]|nr:hypothetical protein [Salinibacter ruber]MCS4057179.1 hypothetical protein [Salinibacter ruber]